MKKNVFSAILFVFGFQVAVAQWAPVQVGNSNAGISSMYSWMDEVFVGTLGDGIFRSTDNGESWTDISGDIGNKTINFIDGAETIMFVGTQDGPFLSVDLMSYTSASGSGLGSLDVSFYGIGYSAEGENTFAVGTNGAGLFTSFDNPFGPWSNANSGLTGDALIINSLNGYYDPEDVTYNVLATNAGIYFSEDALGSWTPKNNGLTGESLIVKEAYALGSLPIIATHGGLYASLDFGDSWLPLIPEVKLNDFLFSNLSDETVFFAFGESNYFSYDLETWYPINMNGFDGGEITKAAVGGGYIYVVSETPGRSGGNLFRAPADQVVSLDERVSPSGTLHQLSQNHPNPFSGQTTISYYLSKDTQVELLVMDINGRVIDFLVNNIQQSGRHNVTFDASALSSGVYFYQLKTGNNTIQTKKMIVR